MRYAEGPEVCCDVHVEAVPSRVWSLVTDIGLPARLSSELQRTEWLDGAEGPELGARFAGYNRHPLVGEWRTISHVVELEERRVFGWAVFDPDGRYEEVDPNAAEPLATWRFELRPEGTGTRLGQFAHLGPAPSGLTLAIERAPEREEEFVAFRLAELRTNMEATLRGIKALAEQPLS